MAGPTEPLGVAAVRRFQHRDAAVLWSRAFGNDDDAEAGAALVALPDAGGHFVEVVRNLRNQDHVGAAGDTGVQRDPPGVAAHHFHHHDAAMGLGGGVQTIDGVGGEADGGVEAEAAGGADDVVVDRLRHTDQRNALLVELVGDRQCAVAADADERIEVHLREHLHHPFGVVERAFGCDDRLDEWIAPVDGSEDGAAEAEDAR